MTGRNSFSVVCLASVFLLATTYSREFPSPILVSDATGSCYVKSSPRDRQGQGGGTRVYRVRRGEDELVHSFDWYSRSLAIKCGNIGPRGKFSISLVRMGGGSKSELGETSGRVTLALYLDGEVLAEYSTMDMALLPESRSTYPRGRGTGFSRVLGFRRLDSRKGFELCTADGRILGFDISTGDLVDQRRDITDRCEQRNSQYYRRIVTTYYREQNAQAGFLHTATTYSREAPSPILISDASGHCYVKSVPPNRHGQSRGTRVYQLGTEKDQLLHKSDWYSSDLDVKCGYFDSRQRGRRDRFSASLVRMGRGWKGELGKTSVAVTLAFYLHGKVLAEYSRMDIAFLPGNRRFDPAGSWRGYWRPLGYGRSGSSSGFEICTVDGRVLLFDFTNGDFVRQTRDYSGRCEPLSPQRSPDFQKIVTTYY